MKYIKEKIGLIQKINWKKMTGTFDEDSNSTFKCYWKDKCNIIYTTDLGIKIQ